MFFACNSKALPANIGQMKLLKIIFTCIKNLFNQPRVQAPIPVPLAPPPHETAPAPAQPVKHVNSGRCLKCEQIFDKYPGFYAPLREWFFSFQAVHISAHISCAGRGREDQRYLHVHKLTNAQWTESAHNWNAAIDIFFLVMGSASYDQHLYYEYLWPEMEKHPEFKWFGAPDTKFFELPHVQVRPWVDLAKAGELNLVEDPNLAELLLRAQQMQNAAIRL
jgi:hypothetical protein